MNIVMSSRVTIVLQDDLMKKLRAKQSKMIQNSNSSISFSKVIDGTLREYIKQSK